MVVLGFYVSPTAKVIRRRDLGLKSHPKDFIGGKLIENIIQDISLSNEKQPI